MTEYLEFARTSAKNGAELVARLMAFCRNSDRVKQQINPAELVKETMALLRRAITRRIEIKTTLGPETWTIFGEEALLKQVLIIMESACRAESGLCRQVERNREKQGVQCRPRLRYRGCRCND